MWCKKTPKRVGERKMRVVKFYKCDLLHWIGSSRPQSAPKEKLFSRSASFCKNWSKLQKIFSSSFKLSAIFCEDLQQLWAVVVAQSAEQILSTQAVCGSNLTISKVFLATGQLQRSCGVSSGREQVCRFKGPKFKSRRPLLNFFLTRSLQQLKL